MILMYHKVHPETPTKWWVSVDAFWRQMEELRRYKIVSLDEYNPDDPKHACITFDGVYENVYQFALPILRKFGYPFELFITSAVIGRSNEFDQAEEPPARFATREQLAKCVRAGGRLQWHTVTHPDCTTLDAAALAYELTVPEDVRELDPQGFGWFAYPYGKHNPTVVDEVKRRFRGALSCVGGNNSDRYQLNRLEVTSETRFPSSSVSLIIANYNYGRFAAEAIESALHQTVLPEEILFIDDCSVDNSMEIAERYKDRIRIVRNERNLGIVANFNKAVSLTNGEYICFLGADNRLRSDYVEKCKLALDTHPEAAIAYTDVALFGPRAEVLAQRVGATSAAGTADVFLWRFVDFTEETRRSLAQNNFIHGSSMYRRKAFEQVGGYKDSAGPEDHHLFVRMVNAGWSAVHCAEFLLEYRQHSGDQANTQLNAGLEMAYWKKQYKQLKQQYDQLAGRAGLSPKHAAEKPVIAHLLAEIDAVLERGDTTAALQRLRRSFTCFPEQAKLHFRYFRLLQALGRTAEADFAFDLAMQYDPSLPEIHNELGVRAFHRGNLKLALQNFERAVRLDRDFLDARKNLADLYVHTGRPEDAIPHLRYVLSRSSDDAEALLSLGSICVSLDWYGDAFYFFNRVLAVDPSNETARELVEALQAKGFTPVTAESELNELLRPTSSDRRYHPMLTLTRRDAHNPNDTGEGEYRRKLGAEIARYAGEINVHDLPPINHVVNEASLSQWLKELTGESDIRDWWAKEISEMLKSRAGNVRVLSIGCGNGDVELDVLARVCEPERVQLLGLDLNPTMIERANALAAERGFPQAVFSVQDLNNVNLSGQFDVVLASHSLHHIVALEKLFAAIDAAASEQFIFLVNDMIGRNGHVMWPATSSVVRTIWDTLDRKYKYNAYWKTYDDEPMNHDCSSEGFEGIRAQDILPLLIQWFDCEMFLPFATIINRFTDRGYGHNFHPDDPQDRDLIMRILDLDLALLKEKKLAPVQCLMKLRTKGAVRHLRYLFQTPEEVIQLRSREIGREEFVWGAPDTRRVETPSLVTS